MRRALRLLLMTMILLSTLICVGVVGLWVRSWTAWDMLMVDSSHLWLLKSYRGDVQFEWISGPSERIRQAIQHAPFPCEYFPVLNIGRPIPSRPASQPPVEWTQLGVDLYWGEKDYYDLPKLRRWTASPATAVSIFSLIIPHAHLAALTATPGLLWLFSKLRKRRRISRRRRAGLCIACGYDLRATPDRCPECGLQITTD